MDNQLLIQLLYNKTSEIQELLNHFKNKPEDLEKALPLLSDRIHGLQKEFELMKENFSANDNSTYLLENTENDLKIATDDSIELHKQVIDAEDNEIQTTDEVSQNYIMNEADSILNEQLHSNSTEIIGDKLVSQKIQDIRSGIGINDRFLFIRELFDNDVDEYNKTIDFINEADQFALAYNHLKSNKSWDFEDPTVMQFIEITKRKF